jgi:hypothetical protein
MGRRSDTKVSYLLALQHDTTFLVASEENLTEQLRRSLRLFGFGDPARALSWRDIGMSIHMLRFRRLGRDRCDRSIAHD